MIRDMFRWALALLLLCCASVVEAQTFPKFTGLVVDDAGVLSPEVKADLTQKLEALQKDTKRQLVVATIRDTQGYPLTDYGYRLGRNWGVGIRDVNNGAVLFVAPNNAKGQRGPRIEVGRGLEPIITDALSNVIVQQQMMPKLRNGDDVAGALTAGTDALIQQLRAAPEEQQARLDAAAKSFDQSHARRRSGGGGFPFGIVIVVMIGGFIALSMARRRGRGQVYRGDGGGSGLGQVVMWSIANEIANSALRDRSGGGWGGGGGGWGGGSSGGSDGSWGGGGFTGGGGGDFGGGGASGDW